MCDLHTACYTLHGHVHQILKHYIAMESAVTSNIDAIPMNAIAKNYKALM